MRGDPTTCGLRVDRQNEAHTHVSVFAGRNTDARGHAGVLVFRTDEWNELVILGVDRGRLVLAFDVLEPSPQAFPEPSTS